jgi:hypothetical protein
VASKKRKRRRPGAGPPPQRRKQTPDRARAAAAAAAKEDERPPAPWGSFPLVEIVVLVGIVMLVAGFIIGGKQGSIAIATGLVLASLAGLEISIREHFAGYRSHSFLLAGFAAVVVLGLLFYVGPESVPVGARLAVGAAVFGGGAWALAQAFRRRAGVRVKLR